MYRQKILFNVYITVQRKLHRNKQLHISKHNLTRTIIFNTDVSYRSTVSFLYNYIICSREVTHIRLQSKSIIVASPVYLHKREITPHYKVLLAY